MGYIIKVGDEFDSLRSATASTRWRVVDFTPYEKGANPIVKLIGQRVGPPPDPVAWRDDRRKATAIDRFAGWVLGPPAHLGVVKVVSREALLNSSDYCRVTETVQGGLFTNDEQRIAEGPRAPPTTATPTPTMSTLMNEPMMQFFEYKHLPPALQAISVQFHNLAATMLATLPRNPERTAFLRKLLEAKDCAVRAVLYKDAQP